MKKTQLAAFLLLSIVFASCTQEKAYSKPNIIIINVDDMGWKDVGYMGSTYYETPNIDALSKLGKVFTNGYAASANCAPSRASLMTGKWTTRHGMYTVNSSERGKSKNRKIIPTKNIRVLTKAHTTLPTVLNQNGYTTIHAGKWHISKNPLNYGFDINIGGGSNGHPRSYFPPYKNVVLKAGEKTQLTDAIMEKTIAQIESVKQPFFLNYAPYAVHTPIQPIQRLLTNYKEKSTSNGQNNAAYATMIENLDSNIGLLIETLKTIGKFDNTLLVFTSDNGGLFGITNQHPLRAGKGSYYEGGIREPFFFVWKNNIKANTTSDIPITNIDLFPTLLEAAGVDNSRYQLDGNSLLPVLKDEVQELKRPLFWHFPIYLQAYKVKNNENRDPLFRTRPGSVVRVGDWKLHYYFENNEIELYNLATDIGEKNNVAEEHKEKASELLLLLKNWWKETNAPIPTELNPEFAPTKRLKTK
ncbi:MAG: sulfatase, partial [Flavobacteriaceae bacterium]|nr:sulfatase [Flavobacteriaceae bacterium]